MPARTQWRWLTGIVRYVVVLVLAAEAGAVQPAAVTEPDLPDLSLRLDARVGDYGVEPDLELAQSTSSAGSTDTPAVTVEPTPADSTAIDAENAVADVPEPLAESATTTGAASGAYVDQVIDPDRIEAERLEEARRAAEAPPIGRRFLSLEYRYFHENGTVRQTRDEHGAILRASQETPQHGTFSVEARGRYENADVRPEESVTEYLAIRQDEFALNENWLADSALGDQTATAHPLVSRSYRRTLGSSLMRGATSRIYGDDRELGLTLGRIGALLGNSTRTFDADEAMLGGVGYAQRLDENWSFAVQGWLLRDDLTEPDHESVAAAAGYADAESNVRGQLHTLFDSKGNAGIWADGDVFVDRWQHRFGLFRLDPDLLWTDVPISNDVEGFYWRADRRGFRRTWAVGADLAQSNVRDDDDRFGAVRSSGFVNLSWRLRRTVTVGGSGRFRLLRPGNGLGDQSSQGYEVSSFLTNEFDFGQSRFEVRYVNDHGRRVDADGYRLTWDQDWAIPRGQQLNTTLEYEYTDDLGERAARTNAGASYRVQMRSDLSFRTDVALTGTDGQTRGDLETANVNVGLRWLPRRNWELDVDGTWNKNVLFPSVGDDSTVFDRRLFVTLRYVESSGQAPVTYGLRADQSGTGTITGRVFFDENRDGRWSPTERVAAGVLVYLDRRFTQVTDHNGLYTFTPVFAGEHAVIVSLDDVPLPFGLDEESARIVSVGVREVTTLDFPLVRLDQ